MPRVRTIFTALAFLVTGALATTITAQAPAAIVAAPAWHANSIGTSSTTARDEFYQGLRDLDAERFIAARDHFNAAVAADPNFAIGQLYAAFNGASLADYKTHLDAAVRAVDGATPAEQLWIRAERKNADNDVTGQIELAEQAVQAMADNPRVYLYLAGAQFNANKRAESRATLERATQVDPSYAQSWIQLGNSYLVTEPRDIEKADAYIRKAVALQPNEAVVHDYMGDVFRAENKLPEARAEYTRMAELAPNRGEGFQQRGHVNSFLGNFAEARADYDRAIALSDPTLKPQYATFRALVSVYANDPAAAESELDRIASTTDPSSRNASGAKIFALTSEARIALHNRHLDVAQRAIDQVREVYRQQAAEEGRSDAFRRNGEVNIAYWEGMLAARRGDYAGARAKAQSIMTLVAQDQSPRKNEPAHELLALTDYLQGNFQAAADHYAEANADDPYIWYYRGLALDGAGHKAQAKEFFKRVAGWNFNGANAALVKNDARKRA
jgi:tetratricopeptide (TPR) repeat protein